MVDPNTGKKVVRVAFTREEASFIGQQGDRIGDVVYFLNPPFQIFDGKVDFLNPTSRDDEDARLPETFDARVCYGAHAYYLPSTKVGGFAVSSPLIMSGPAFKEGIELEQPVNLVDIAPTISYILSIPVPAQSQGRVLHEALG
jgi:hypothetical protein